MNERLGSPEKRILVVDDDHGSRESLKLLLGIDGHQVTEAVDGAEALGEFRKQAFDLVITDYLMPRMRGDELARNLRTLVPEQPIVMVTGYFENICCAPVPADAVLAKPFGVAELRLAIAGPMARRSPSSRGSDQAWPELSQDALRERADTTTFVLSDILKSSARPGSRPLPDNPNPRPRLNPGDADPDAT